MKKLFIISVIITTISCNKSEETDDIIPYNSSIISASVEFSIVNDQDEDLLNPENPGHINEDDINLYYLIDGEKRQVYDPMMDYPKNFKIYKHQDQSYRIIIFLNHTETSDKPVTYVEWNQNDIDTIEATYARYDNGGILSQDIWLNGGHIWERGNNAVKAYFKLIK